MTALRQPGDGTGAGGNTCRETPFTDRNISIAILAVSTLYYSLYYNYGLVLFDEGHFLNLAERILDGQRYYADWWTLYPPGRFYLIAGLFKLFGVNLIVTRIFWAALKVLTGLLFFRSARNIMGRPYALFSAMLIVLVPGHWHLPLFLLLPLCFLLVFLRYIRYGGRRWLVAAGLVCGIALFTRQDTGMFIFLAAVVSMAANHALCKAEGVERGGLAGDYASFVLSALLSGLLLYWIVSGSYIRDVLYGLFVVPFVFIKEVSTPFPRFIMHGGLPGIISPNNLAVAFFYVPFAACAAAALYIAVRAVKKKCELKDRMLIPVLLLAAISITHYMSQSNTGHLLRAMPLSIMLAAFMCGEAVRRMKSGNKTAGHAAAVLFAAAGVAFVTLFVFSKFGRYDNSGSIGRMLGPKTYYSNPRGGVYLDGIYAARVKAVVDYISSNTASGDYVMFIPHDSMLAFYADRRNPTRYEYFVAGFLTGQDQRRAAADLSKAKYIVYFEPKTFIDYPRKPEWRFSNYCRELYEGVMPMFEFDRKIMNYIVLRRADGDHPDTLHFMNGYIDYQYGDLDGAKRELGMITERSASYTEAGRILGLTRNGGR